MVASCSWCNNCGVESCWFMSDDILDIFDLCLMKQEFMKIIWISNKELSVIRRLFHFRNLVLSWWIFNFYGLWNILKMCTDCNIRWRLYITICPIHRATSLFFILWMLNISLAKVIARKRGRRSAGNVIEYIGNPKHLHIYKHKTPIYRHLQKSL